MTTQPSTTPADLFNSKFFPQHVTLVTVADNMMPMGYWTVISKEPFRFLICMQMGNYTFDLIKKYQEAILHFMPWDDRERVVKAGNITGRYESKAEKLGFELIPAEKMVHTKMVAGADSAYETVVLQELEGLSREFGLFVLEVVAVHGNIIPKKRDPIMFLSGKDFATLGEKWRYRPGM